MKTRRLSYSPVRDLTLLLLTASALSGCSVFKAPTPPTLPQGALVVTQEPVAVKVLLVDDGGNKTVFKAVIPAGWSAMYVGSDATTTTAKGK